MPSMLSSISVVWPVTDCQRSTLGKQTNKFQMLHRAQNQQSRSENRLNKSEVNPMIILAVRIARVQHSQAINAVLEDLAVKRRVHVT